MRLLIGFLLLWSLPLWAQTYPEYARTTVNDYADLLDGETEDALHDRLIDLKRQLDVELTVLTIVTQADFAPDASLESFATGLFNEWGIGDAGRNDGVLVLVVRDDRAMRIELGAGYGRNWDRAAALVIDDYFLPPFRDGDMQAGIVSGVDAVIRIIVEPARAGQTEPVFSQTEGETDTPRGETDFAPWLVFVAAAVFMLWRRILDALASLRPCPNCGQRQTRRSRKVLVAATRTVAGTGKLTTRCANCDYLKEDTYRISRLGKSSSGSFGGGRSGGGGASGRW